MANALSSMDQSNSKEALKTHLPNASALGTWNFLVKARR